MTPSGPKQITPVALLDVASRSSVVAELWRPITEENLADWEALWAPATLEQIKVLHQAEIERRLWPDCVEKLGWCSGRSFLSRSGKNAVKRFQSLNQNACLLSGSRSTRKCRLQSFSTQSPQSRSWDWRNKQEAIRARLGNESFAVMQGGKTQAMMIVDLAARARLDEQARQHMVYIEFLEAAPWNRKTLTGDQPQFAGAGSILIGAAIELSLEQGFKGRIGLHSLPQSNDFYANACGMRDLGADGNYSNLRYFEMTPEIAAVFLRNGA